MRIITISGSAQHGKDTFAQAMKETFEQEYHKKIIIFHYADFLKFIARQWYNWNGQKDEEGRTLLQHLGTDVFRKNRPDCWVNIAKEFILGLGDTVDAVIIPDTRFPNEIEILQSIPDVSVTTIKVIRDNFDNGLTSEQKQHPSETALSDWQFDICIHNDGNLQQYQDLAKSIVELIF